MASDQTNLAWDTLLDLGDPDPGPLHVRLAGAIRTAVRDGRLPEGSALPPSRDMAAGLSCSRWVVTEAYEQLVAEGYLEARIGSGTRVRRVEEPHDADAAAWWAAARGNARRSAEARRAEPAIDLAPGLPDLRFFPLSAWMGALRTVTAALPYTELGYPSVRGHYRLRAVLAAYLVRVRGAVVDPSDVTVTSGVTDGATRLFRALRASGVTAVAVEDPGWGRLRDAARVAGIEHVPVPVDEHGLQVEHLARRPDVRAAIVSPAHQFPTGSVLAPERRAALLDWARRVDGLILEDDYDAEFRYDRRPVGTMQGTDPSRVALLGSLSKTLSPALGIGWLADSARLVRGRARDRGSARGAAAAGPVDAGGVHHLGRVRPASSRGPPPVSLPPRRPRGGTRGATPRLPRVRGGRRPARASGTSTWNWPPLRSWRGRPNWACTWRASRHTASTTARTAPGWCSATATWATAKWAGPSHCSPGRCPRSDPSERRHSPQCQGIGTMPSCRTVGTSTQP